MAENPTAIALASKLLGADRARLARDWKKACDRLGHDNEGAVTAAKTLLESVCKYTLDVIGEPYDDGADITDIYSRVSKVLGISAGEQSSRVFKQFFGATRTVVQSVGELRNKVGDAHGKGQQAISPSKAQAELAVNLAGAVANFLLSSLEGYISATRRLTVDGKAILKFDKGTVWRLVDHAENAPSHKKALRERKTRPSLWLVGDAGIYLMSNGDPPQLHDGRTAKSITPGEVVLLVAYADGCAIGDEFDHWWPIHNTIDAGSDFCLPIRLKFIRRALEISDKKIVIVCGPDDYSILADREYSE